MSLPSPELMGSDPTARVAEQAQRQEAALLAIKHISRAVGHEMPIIQGDYIPGSEPGVYILDEALQADRAPIVDVDFSLDQQMLSGAADSAHAVLAGTLAIERRDGDNSSTIIAAKCYRKRTSEDRLIRMQREVSISRDMARRGELALEPVAVAVAPTEVADGSVVLLTRYQEGLYTLDSLPWGRGQTDDNIENAVLAASTLGRFNTLGYAHRDAKIKNIAQQIDGKTGMIDFETSTPFDLSNPLEAAGAAHSDLGLMLDSLATKHFFEPPSNPGYDNSYNDSQRVVATVSEICDAYLENWADAESSVQLAVLQAVGEISDSVTARYARLAVAV